MKIFQRVESKDSTFLLFLGMKITQEWLEEQIALEKKNESLCKEKGWEVLASHAQGAQSAYLNVQFHLMTSGWRVHLLGKNIPKWKKKIIRACEWVENKLIGAE